MQIHLGTFTNSFVAFQQEYIFLVSSSPRQLYNKGSFPDEQSLSKRAFAELLLCPSRFDTLLFASFFKSSCKSTSRFCYSSKMEPEAWVKARESLARVSGGVPTASDYNFYQQQNTNFQANGWANYKYVVFCLLKSRHVLTKNFLQSRLQQLSIQLY